MAKACGNLSEVKMLQLTLRDDDFSRFQAAFRASRQLATLFMAWLLIRKMMQGVLTSFSSALASIIKRLKPFSRKLKRPLILYLSIPRAKVAWRVCRETRKAR